MRAPVRFLMVGFVVDLLARMALVASPTVAGEEPWVLDHRYPPPWWQTLICLPDDWQKTLVGREGQMLYDYPGPHHDFQTQITLDLEGGSQWAGQELSAPRVPVVRTRKAAAGIELVEETFAVAPLLPAGDAPRPAVVERLDEGRSMENWAVPSIPCDAAFRDIAVAMNGPVRYRFAAEPGQGYTVVFGLCEGYWSEPGRRPMELVAEGAARRRIDLVAEHGRNVPVLLPLTARDANGDGHIEVAVEPAADAPDKNTILNVLWVFAGDPPPLEELLVGQSSRPALARIDCGREGFAGKPLRHDVLLARLRNTGPTEAAPALTLTIQSQQRITPQADGRHVLIGAGTRLAATEPFQVVEQADGRLVLRFGPLALPAGGQRSLALGVARGEGTTLVPRDATEAEALLARAQDYWTGLDLPYGAIEVPDAGVQALLDSSVRNIYQAREIKKGLPAFQVGPTCYRGLWVVDGSFLMEAVAYLGRTEEARQGIEYLLSFQRDDGAIMVMDGHWKETGIALWAVTRHARLTNDPAWLAERWPQLERGWEYIRAMRAATLAELAAPQRGLIPPGFSDGGLGGKHPEYTNVYWTLVGMKAAVAAARWLGRDAQAADWQREYDDFYATFRRAAERDARDDGQGGRYLPIRMVDPENVPPQKAQWAFLHAVFPGQVFAPDDPLVQGNLALLRRNECEGLVRDTGWVARGVWNYFGSFYGHGWLWTGDGRKAAQSLYAMGNHASPLLAWREEQMPQGEGGAVCGDMPHNWASAEFIRLTRHLLVLERGDELHLAEGLPPAWVKPGAVVRLRGAVTEFGPVSLALRAAEDGKSVQLHVEPPQRNPPRRIVLHLDSWSGRSGTLELPLDTATDRRIALE